MRAIFMIPTKPPPSFREPDKWSPEFIDFVSGCLVKNPDRRATATDLLLHEFIGNAKAPNILSQMIADAHTIRENQHRNTNISAIGAKSGGANEESDDEIAGSGTMVNCTEDGTLIPSKGGTLLPMSPSGTLVELQSDLGTMVINSDVDEQTMKSKY